jgi:hypothetical protein
MWISCLYPIANVLHLSKKGTAGIFFHPEGENSQISERSMHSVNNFRVAGLAAEN